MNPVLYHHLAFSHDHVTSFLGVGVDTVLGVESRASRMLGCTLHSERTVQRKLSP
jgi:hypothetical protein